MGTKTKTSDKKFSTEEKSLTREQLLNAGAAAAHSGIAKIVIEENPLMMFAFADYFATVIESIFEDEKEEEDEE